MGLDHIHAPARTGKLVRHGIMGPAAEFHGIAGHPEPDFAHNVSAKHKMSLLSFFIPPIGWYDKNMKTSGRRCSF